MNHNGSRRSKGSGKGVERAIDGDTRGEQEELHEALFMYNNNSISTEYFRTIRGREIKSQLLA